MNGHYSQTHIMLIKFFIKSGLRIFLLKSTNGRQIFWGQIFCQNFTQAKADDVFSNGEFSIITNYHMNIRKIKQKLVNDNVRYL